jgi:hypothetical protein
MKIKSLFVAAVIALPLLFIACNDDLNTLGGSIQPPSDTISVATDTVLLQARTTKLDSIYARTTYGVLGKYEDDVFGTIKSDYLCQMYYPDDVVFKGKFKQIDSTQFVIDYVTFFGDSLAPMGLSVYQVTSPLEGNYYTNIDPAKYCDMSKVLASEAFTIHGSKRSGTARRVIADLGTDFGQSFYDAWANGTFKNKDSFNQFFPGMYVTTNFGSGSLIKVAYTSIDIYYSYVYTKDGAERDTTGWFSISATPEVIQMNHLANSNPDELFAEGSGATYLKTPGGVCTEIDIPIAQIAANMEQKRMSNINSVQLALKGYTEKEPDEEGGLVRPSYHLLIDKDSIQSFFTKRNNVTDGVTSSLIARTTASNTYNFSNIASIITHYKKEGKDKVTFSLLPVEVNMVTSSSSSTSTITGIYHYMMPSTAILRNDPENMRLELVYSKF